MKKLFLIPVLAGCGLLSSEDYDWAQCHQDREGLFYSVRVFDDQIRYVFATEIDTVDVTYSRGFSVYSEGPISFTFWNEYRICSDENRIIRHYE